MSKGCWSGKAESVPLSSSSESRTSPERSRLMRASCKSCKNWMSWERGALTCPMMAEMLIIIPKVRLPSTTSTAIQQVTTMFLNWPRKVNPVCCICSKRSTFLFTSYCLSCIACQSLSLLSSQAFSLMSTTPWTSSNCLFWFSLLTRNFS